MKGDPYYVCQRCAACCKWPGDVKVSEREVEQIATFLELPVASFIERFTRLRMNRQGLSLIEKDNDECIMLEGNRCLIQDVKPQQCRDFPNKWNFPGWESLCSAKPIFNQKGG